MLLIISYVLYLIITAVITFYVGWLCYKNGIHYIQAELKDEVLANAVNRFFFIGYYLTNLGYAAIMIYNWDQVNNMADVINALSKRISFIVLSMGGMHYLNITLIYLLRQNNKTSINKNNTNN